jgi:hypothetical protein
LAQNEAFSTHQDAKILIKVNLLLSTAWIAILAPIINLPDRWRGIKTPLKTGIVPYEPTLIVSRLINQASNQGPQSRCKRVVGYAFCHTCQLVLAG